MRWAGRRESSNVEDRRGVPARGLAVGGGLGTLAIVVIALLAGIDPTEILGPMQQGPPNPGVQDPGAAQENSEAKQFVGVVLADTEDVWHALFKQQYGRDYREPKLVLFTQQVESGCGIANAGVGPFYCPADECVYLDLSFFDELKQRFQAPGDFAAAYVVAHEVGHHVQNQLGISDQVHDARQRLSEEDYNRQSVRLELQADFLAGVWAHHAQRTKNILETGDIEEAMGAASAVGDDRIQKQARGYVTPDSFTHGSSAQRARWFREGLRTGDVSKMDLLFSLPDNQL